jgi:hypothetical protein
MVSTYTMESHLETLEKILGRHFFFLFEKEDRSWESWPDIQIFIQIYNSILKLAEFLVELNVN